LISHDSLTPKPLRMASGLAAGCGPVHRSGRGRLQAGAAALRFRLPVIRPVADIHAHPFPSTR
jgi:hypothetical protein